MRARLVAIVLTLALVVHGGGQVNVDLVARWNETSVLQEASEFFAESGRFWVFLAAVAEGRLGALSDKAAIHALSESGFARAHEVPLLGFALSIRAYSPAVEAHRQMASVETLPAECTGATGVVFVALIDGSITCSLETVRALASGDATPARRAEPVALTSAEHEWPGLRVSDPTAPLALLYADVSSDMALAAHAALAGGADSGRWRYVFRHMGGGRGTAFALSGYGVELAVKNTEYKVVDDTAATPGAQPGSATASDADADADADTDALDEPVAGLVFSRLVARFPASADALLALRRQLLDETPASSPELTALDANAMRNLGVQLVARVLGAREPRGQLGVLSELVATLPSAVTALASTRVNGTVARALAGVMSSGAAASLFALAGSTSGNAVFLNGRAVAVETISAFSLLALAIEDSSVATELAALGYTANEARALLALPMGDPSDGNVGPTGGGGGGAGVGGSASSAVSKVSLAPLVHAGGVSFLNNLQKDPMYARWSTGVRTIVQTPPGQFAYVRANVVSFLLLDDPTCQRAVQSVFTLSQFHQRAAPARFGLAVFVPDLVALLTAEPELEFDVALPAHRAISPAGVFALAADWLGELGLGRFVWELAVNVGSQTGWQSDASVAQVGLALEALQLPAKVPRKTLVQLLDEPARHERVFARQRAIALTRLPAGTAVGNTGVYIDVDMQSALIAALSSEQAALRAAVLAGEVSDTTDLFAFACSRPDVLSTYSRIPIPSNERPLRIAALGELATRELVDALGGLACARDAFGTVPRASVVVAGAFGLRTDTTDAAREALNFANSDSCTAARVAFVDLSTDGAAPSARATALVGLTAVAQLARDKCANALRAVLDASDTSLGGLAAAMAQAGLSVDELAQVHAAGARWTARAQAFARTTLGARVHGPAVLLANARVVTLVEGDRLSSADLAVIAQLEATRGARLLEAVEAAEFTAVSADDKSPMWYASLLRQTVSVLASDSRRAGPLRASLPASVDGALAPVSFVIAPAASSPLDALFVLDPLSTEAQRLVPLARALAEGMGARVRVALLPPLDVSSVPVTRYYRAALEPQLGFDARGARAGGPRVSFARLPQQSTLTVGLDVPDAWLVEAVVAKYDLDNVRLADVVAGETVDARFALAHLLVEGSCANGAAPAAGVQLLLGEQSTVVMANLGYWQLKSRPGLWTLTLLPGRSADLFTLLAGGSASAPVVSISVVVRDFVGSMMSLHVRRRPGRENIPLLEETGGLWSSFSNWVSPSSSAPNTIHVFSIASGHLYERFLRIMALSVMRHTTNPVKFWFVSNFLSPQFRASMPALAAKFGFEFEFVTYRWPRWLHPQTVKQRLIWAYKILFLDVLFPHDVDRVIFVDADQVVRADLDELRRMDLNGAPYGFTPFCYGENANSETLGFRFWDSGYWAGHLRGRPYHISALFVVDLKRLRQIAGADQLRGTYHGLAADPNSLSNLDQDLPNYLSHQLPIFSLPQEWLWCESWCAMELKPRAKTIDLCNSPLTKVPKLENAKKSLPEWVELDSTIRAAIDEAAAARDASGHDEL